MQKHLLTLLFLAFFCSTQAQSVILNKPDAPAASFTYWNGIFQLTLSNPATSNNFNEGYLEMDPGIDSTAPSQLMAFQGYIIYQLAHDSVLPSQMDDISLARIVGQSDLQDTMIDAYNTLYDSAAQFCVTIQAVSGNNAGVEHVYNLDTDVFTGAPFSDGETYCFLPIAYATNPWRENPSCPGSPHQFVRSVRGPTGGALLNYCVNADIDLANGQVSSDEFLMRIFPNPASNQVNVQFVGAELAQLNCYDLLGNLVHNQSVSSNELIDLANFRAGVYLLEIKVEEKAPITQKLVIR